MLWIAATIAASAFQVARNAAQRGLIGDAGPWGATLVRFLFGLPFALVFTAVAWWASGRPDVSFSLAYVGFALGSATAQLFATAALLGAMQRAGFAVGIALQQSSLPLAGILGWLVFGDGLGPMAWVGVAIVTVGVTALSWPKKAEGDQPLSGAMFGLLSGLLFGFALNGFRHADLALAPRHPAFAALATVAFAQAAQSAGLGVWLAWRRPEALRAVARNWRGSLFAGFCGAVASSCWLFALAIAPAASVRAVGVIESPMAAAAGRRLFAEKLSLAKWAAGALTALGVVLTALG